MADAIAKGAQGFVGKEKPVGAIIEALEMAHQGHLAVGSVLGGAPNRRRRGRQLTRAGGIQTETNLRRGGLLAGEPPT